MPAYFSLPADPAFVGGKNLMICSFLGDELPLDGVGLADGADIFVWNGKEVKDPNTLSLLVSSEERTRSLQTRFWKYQSVLQMCC